MSAFGSAPAYAVALAPALALGLALAFMLPFTVPLHAAAQAPPPNADYWTIRTDHFRVTFPAELEAVAGRAAVLAEEAHALLSARFFPAPSGTIDLLLTDHIDGANGLAAPFPSNRVTIWVQPPLDGLALSQFDDWLDLVITHEVAHIFHFEQVGVPGRVLRSIFGRAPERWPYFSATAVPLVAIEGIAVYQELALLGSGRLHGTFHSAMVRARVAEGASDRVDQGLGTSPVWPGANRPYVYGSLFVEYLTRTFGEAAVVRFLRATAEQWIPFRLDAAARDAFGVSFESLWAAWMDNVRREVETLRTEIDARTRTGPAPTRIEILTGGGGSALYADAGPQGVAYVRDDDRSDTRLRVRTPLDDDRSLGRWNLLHAPPRWGVEGTLFVPQTEFVDDFRLLRDLWTVRPDGSTRRSTEGLRVLHVDPHPRGETIAAVLAGEEGNRLVLFAPTGEAAYRVGAVLRDEEPGVFWSFPAWSPEGDRLAVARRGPDGRTAIAILDASGRLLLEVGSDRSQNSYPAWSPAGDVLLWGSDRSGVPNLYAAIVGASGGPPPPAPLGATTVLQVTDVLTGVAFPSVSPDGAWIYLSVLGADGWALGRTAYDRATWRPASPPLPRFLEVNPTRSALTSFGGGAAAPAGPGVRPLPQELAAAPYSALSTLLPRYWLPVRVGGEGAGKEEVIGDRWGARTSGYDLVGRHRYAAWVAAPLVRPFGRAEGSFWYQWAGLGDPAVSFEVSQDWMVRGDVVVQGEGGDPDTTLYPSARERRLGADIEFRRRKVRSLWLLSVGGRWIEEDRHLFDADGRRSDLLQYLVPQADFVEPRATLAVTTARAHPFSVSLQDGVTGAVTYRLRRHVALPDSLSGVAGADGSLWDLTGSLRAYRGIPLFGFADHVLAVRLAGGISGGSGAGTQHFGVGGDGRFFGVRGVPDGVVRGGAAWSFSAEWRFPVALLNRGIGAWPLHADRLAGSFFWDVAGGVPEPGSGGGESTASFGVEAVLSYSLLFEESARIRAGIAFPTGSRTPSVHLGSAWSF